MIKPIPFANAFALVGLGIYVGCRLLSLIVPDLLFSVGRSWFHTFNLGPVKETTPFEIGTFLVGGITTGALIWITFYAGAYLYNKFTR